MINPTSRLTQYLFYLQTYLNGDLRSFRQKCSSCEEEEKTQKISQILSSPVTSSIGAGSYGPPPATTITTTSSSTTLNTTLFPTVASAEFETPIFFRSTIPHTQTLFSNIDTLGFLMRNETDYTKTWKNFESFFKGYPISKDEKDVLLNVYRHGMTHGYFPKLGVGISYHSTHVTKPLFFKDSSGRLVLNVNELEKIVINKLEEIVKNHSPYPNMESQFTFLEDDYESKSGNLIRRLKSQIS